MNEKSWNGDVIFSFILLILGVVLVIGSFNINQGVEMVNGGELMPRIIAFLWVCLSVITFIIALAKSAKESKEYHCSGDQKGFLLTLGLLLLYLLLITIFGFRLSSIVYLFLQILIFTPKAKRNYYIIILISVVLPLLVYWIFNSLFELILPKGILF
ncbi:MAG: tripartite tricarboxylate transporter TctB family protein [Sphaerochaetaceae bacterium]